MMSRRLLIVFAAGAVGLSGCASLSGLNVAGSSIVGLLSGKQGELSPSEQAEVCLHTGLGLAAHQKDEHAIAQLTKARDLNPSLGGVSHELAVLYDRQGQFGKAEREYQQAMAEGRPTADLLNDFGYFRYVQGNFVDAESLLMKAKQLDPDHPRVDVNLAMVHFAAGNYDQSFALFEETVGTAAAHQNMGVLLMRDGQQQRAITHLQQAVSVDPSLNAAATILADMQQADVKRSIRLANFSEFESSE